MRKIIRLKREALESCKFRGHNMTRFRTIREWEAISVCKTCGNSAFITAQPKPNEVEIMGSAVALYCS